MGLTVAQTIQLETGKAVDDNEAIIVGQCLTAVGWVGGTVPERPGHPNIVELSMADVAGGSIAVGMALDLSRKVIYVVRYQGFLWYNSPSIVNYAAISKVMWGVPCPILVRAIAMEGRIGPVAGGSHHSLLLRMPGLTVVAPMTPGEWRDAWEYSKSSDDPMVISEHRKSYGIDFEMRDEIEEDADVTIVAISAARLSALEAATQLRQQGIRVNLFHLTWLSPVAWPEGLIGSLSHSSFGVVVDSDYAKFGTASSVANDLSHSAAVPVFALGLERSTAGFSEATDNLTPASSAITQFVLGRLSLP